MGIRIRPANEHARLVLEHCVIEEVDGPAMLVVPVDEWGLVFTPSDPDRPYAVVITHNLFAEEAAPEGLAP